MSEGLIEQFRELFQTTDTGVKNAEVFLYEQVKDVPAILAKMGIEDGYSVDLKSPSRGVQILEFTMEDTGAVFCLNYEFKSHNTKETIN